jgi:hypothetical protein
MNILKEYQQNYLENATVLSGAQPPVKSNLIVPDAGMVKPPLATSLFGDQEVMMSPNPYLEAVSHFIFLENFRKLVKCPLEEICQTTLLSISHQTT